MDQKAVFQTVAQDFEAVNKSIHQQLSSNVPMVEKIADHIISSGGKRIRPMLVLLCASLNGRVLSKHHKLATVIEFLHTATLLHDDVVDKSDMRRGKATANANWGNEASVLVGDFLYARAFELLVDIAQLEVMNSLASTTRIIAEGEVMQLMNVRNPDISEEQYFEVIQGKTAILFQASCETAAILSGCTIEQRKLLASYGLNLGLAFQLIDDYLDYAGDADSLGKNVGDDLAEGKPTLPLIHAMKHSSAEESQLIRQCIRKGGVEHLEEVLGILNKTGSLDFVKEKAIEHAKQAQDCLIDFPDNEFKNALYHLAEMAASRKS